jgi:paraquat-inducible protein B
VQEFQVYILCYQGLILNFIRVKTGLKASLVTGNLVTGSQLVELQYFDVAKAEDEVTGHFHGYAVIPVVPNRFSRIGIEVSELVDKLNNLPVESVANST